MATLAVPVTSFETSHVVLADGIRLNYVHGGPIFDVGRKLDFIKATIQLALRRDDLAKPLKEFLSDLRED